MVCHFFVCHFYEFKNRCIAHQRKGIFENKLVQIILRIFLSHLFNESIISIKESLKVKFFQNVQTDYKITRDQLSDVDYRRSVI